MCNTLFTLPRITVGTFFEFDAVKMEGILADAATLDEVAGLERNVFTDEAAALLLEEADHRRGVAA